MKRWVVVLIVIACSPVLYVGYRVGQYLHDFFRNGL